MKQLSLESLIRHWLLNTAIEFPRPLLHILPTPRGISLNAPEVPGCTPADYAQALQDLHQTGYIAFTSEDARDDVQSMSGLRQVLDSFLAYMIEPPEKRYAREKRQVDPAGQRIARVEFALTETGGALWEGISKPEWDRFYWESSDYKTGDAVSPDLTLLMARLGWFPELSNETLDIESLEIEECFDYPVLYWKKLPHVYRATFKCQVGEPRWKKQGRSEYPLEPAWFRRWWPTTVSYYADPWQLADWPRST